LKNDIQIIIESRPKELAGMPIDRVLPWAKKRMVGPFIFLDHIGPTHFSKDQKMNVNAHPHIGLSTLTYLFQGRIHHKDSLGSSVVIVPGEVNWMTAGKGISHSEKTPAEDQGLEGDVHGLQFWVALPDHLEDMAPSFFNFKESSIPKLKSADSVIDVVVGQYENQSSPVEAFSPMIFLNIEALKDFHFQYDSQDFEVALYLINGSVTVGEKTFDHHEMVVFQPGSELSVMINEGTHCVLIGGKTFPGPKQIWWNFVSSSKEKIDLARKNWKEGNFPQVPGETERTPAPEGIF
jgi:redox-sensitive bicupin YhaK (pirin superfamily)